jgi:micrococcal nuclease
MNKFFQRNKISIVIIIVSLLIAGLIYFLSGYLNSFSLNGKIESYNSNSAQIQNGLHKVIRVIDGDTAIIKINGKNKTVRLIGINTPETVDPRRPVECFGIEASNKAKEVLTGKSVRLEADDIVGERGKYGRLLFYVFLEDGTNFNKMMISEGYAYEYTYNLPYKCQGEFKQAEKDARENKRGLWADGVCQN